MTELEKVKKEKKGLDSKLTGFLDTLLGSQRTDKNKEGLPEFSDDTITDYSYPAPSIESNTSDLQNSNSSVSKHGESSDSIMSKPMIKFVKATDSPTVIKTNKVETAKKSSVKYAEMYRNTSKSPKVRGNQSNWNNLKSQQLGKDFLTQNKACFKCGHFDHMAYDCGVWVEKGKNWPKNNFAHKNMTPRAGLLKSGRTPIAVNRTNMNVAQPKRTYFSKTAHSYGNSQNNIDDKGYWDSGFSQYITGNISYLSEYEPYDRGYVSFGQGGGKITGKGIIKTGKLKFENVYFVKDLKYNLFSVSQICDNKNSILFTDSERIVLGKDFKLIDDTNVLLRTPRQHNMYSIDLNNIVPHKDLTCLVTKASTDESMVWHRRLGHLNFKTMNKLVRNNLVKGLPFKCFENDHTCVACLKGKQHKASCKTKLVNYVSKPLHTLHMDLFRPTSVSSLNHKWYCLVVTGDFSRCDNGGEFKNKEMHEFYTRKGIKREFSNARTPQQNGFAERRNITLIEAARTMLADVKLPVTFWAEAVNTACYVQNRVFVNKSHNKTPYELFNSRTPAIGFLKPFGCHVMILNTLDHLRKFDAKGNEGVKKDVSSLRYIALPNWFHGAHMGSSNNDAQDACNADAPESNGISNPTATSKSPPAEQMESLTVESTIPTISSSVPTACLDNSPETSSGLRLISKEVFSQEETPSLDNILTLSNRFEDILRDTTNTVDTNGVEADSSNMETNITASPTPTFRIHKDHPKSQIISHVDTPFCLFSYFLSQEEPKKIFDALKDLWVRSIRIKWVLKNKKGERGTVIKNNAKLVAQGHTQEEGIDYEEVFAPVARIEAIRLFLAYASFMGFKVYQMDVKSAFLYGTIDEEVYVMQPPAFQDLEFPDRVYKVEKAMYGLHLAPRAWYGTLSKYLLANGFQRVLQKKDGIFLSQDKYVGDILKKFRYSDVRSANTPMDKENPWGKDEPGKDVELHLYRSMIGSLMYLIASRPDIMFDVCACVRHQVTPKECHLHAVKRIFRYLRDSDYGGATQDKKSTTGGCQLLGRRLISWQCKKQTIMATSTTEAKYVAGASGCGQVLWIQNQMLDYGYNFMNTKIYIEGYVITINTQEMDGGINRKSLRKK
nr:hypothetical protein [Tanacetum cinerariifolium]